MSHKFKVGDLVSKRSGYIFHGTVVSVFWTTDGKLRYVVEMTFFKLLHIFNEEQLMPTDLNSYCYKAQV